MKILTKSLLGAGAAAAALVSTAAPAVAAHGNRDSISAGDVIAGALIIGGLAAVLSGDDRDGRYDDGRYDDREYRGRGGRHGGGDGYGYDNGRQAVNQCVNAVEQWSSRYSRSKVTEIRDIDRTRYGYKVSGKLVVKDGWRGRDDGRGYGRGDRGRDDYGYRGDDRRYGDRYDDRGGYGRGGNGYERGYDKGRFTCYVERGRVVDVDYRGLDQWR